MTEHISIRHPDKLFIGGVWVNPSTGARISAISPVTELPVLSVPEATNADMDKAAAAAKTAFEHGPWRRMKHSERAAFLREFSRQLIERKSELARAWTLQVGIPAAISATAAIGGARPFDVAVDLSSTFSFEEVYPSGKAGQAVLIHEPVGVVVAIAPWNGPLFLATSKIAPALLAGCTVVLKAAPETPFEAWILAEIAEDIGLPPGVLNVVAGYREASEHLVRNPLIDKVAFTGSTMTGRRIAGILTERMGRYTMELGGKSAAVILDDYDPEKAVQSLTRSISHMSGQVCAALTRVIVPTSLHSEYSDRFAEAMKSLRVGDPDEPGVDVGPLASARQLARVQDYIRKGQAEGAELVCGGGRPPGLDRGYYVEPALFANVDNRMTIAQEEIFGPVLCLIPADGETDAVRIANDTIYGLNGCVFTNNSDRAWRIAADIRSGTVSHNGFRIDPTLSFGGYKQSGVGREGGVGGLRSYLETKLVFLK